MRILVYGLAKTGTTILAARIKCSLEEFSGETVADSFEPKEIWVTDGNVEYVKGAVRQPSVKQEVVKTLFDSGVPPEEVLKHQDHFDKKIFITRDPRDRYISQVFYRWHSGHNPDPKKFRKTLDLATLKERSPSSVPFSFLANQSPNAFSWLRNKISESYEPVISFIRNLSNDWCVIRYEDFVDGQLGELEEYLGFSIKQNVGVGNAHSRVARSKSHGNWRRWYTEEDVAYLKPAFEKYLKFAGYESNDWRLDPVDNLPSSEGSEYMTKLFYGKRSKQTKINKATKFVRRAFNAADFLKHSVLSSRARYRLFPRVEPAEPRLFLHIPKTAGSSFRESLRFSIGEENLVEDYANQRNHKASSPYKFLTEARNPSAFKKHLIKKRNAWVSGHVQYSRYERVIPPSETFAFVRHPVDRLVSAYKHKCRHKGLKLSFEEYVEQDLVHNKQSKYLPLEIISDLAFVGLTEEYSLSLEYLNWRYGLGLIEVQRQKSPKEQGVHVDKRLFDMICEKSSKDFDLYKLAKKIFQEKISEMQSSFNKNGTGLI